MKLSPFQRAIGRRALAEMLTEIEANDTNYEECYLRVWLALSLAATLGYLTGVKLDPEQPGWPVAYIDLPKAGQVSWHIPSYPLPYDGHTTSDKYDRCHTYIGRVKAGEDL